MSDRERLEQAIKASMVDSLAADETLIEAIIRAVDAVRPGPALLTEAWLATAQQHLDRGLTLDAAEVRRLLAHVGIVESILADRCSDTPDRDSLRQEGREAERHKMVELLTQAGRISRIAMCSHVQRAISELEARGPSRPDALHELRAENVSLREMVQQAIADMDRIGAGHWPPVDVLRKALLGGEVRG